MRPSRVSSRKRCLSNYIDLLLFHIFLGNSQLVCFFVAMCRVHLGSGKMVHLGSGSVSISIRVAQWKWTRSLLSYSTRSALQNEAPTVSATALIARLV